ncbi:MAG: hypothetical protein ABS939_08405 [Psychrobacillus sp.]
METRVRWTEEEAREIAEILCSKNGFELLGIKNLPHEDDYYLKYIIAYNKDIQEYATWSLNLSVGGLFYGHYFSHRSIKTKAEAYSKALEDFKDR